MRDVGPKIQKRGNTHNFARIQATQGEQKKLLTLFTKSAAAVWGMDNFNKYLKGSQFTLYADPTPAPELGMTQTKTWNRLRTAMNDHKFTTQNRQNANLPEQLKR
jgi:hypothetical protein